MIIFAVLNILQGGIEPQTHPVGGVFIPKRIIYSGIVPPWIFVMNIQPCKVLSDGKGNAVFLLPIIFHKSLNERIKNF